jgi:type I restriction enzyme, S subunit
MSITQSTSLKKVASVFNGKTPSKAEQRNTGHPVLKIKDVDTYGRFIGLYDSFVEDDVIKKNIGKLLLGNETLILNAAHNADYVGTKVFFSEADVKGALPTGEWLIVRANEAVLDAKFVHYWIQSDLVRKKIRGLVKGIHLYPKDVAELEISLPPLDEQKRIAGILDKADAIRRKRSESLKLLDELLRATFLDMFGDPITNPKGWQKHKIGKLCNVTKLAGYEYTKHFKYKDAGEIIAVRGLNVKNGSLRLKNVHYIDKEISDKLPRSKLFAGDIVMTYIGVNIGDIAYIPESDKYHLAPNVAKITSKDNKNLNPIFLMQFLAFSRECLQSKATNTAKQAFNMKGIRDVDLPLPDSSLQLKYCDIYLATKNSIRAHESSSEELSSLFHSLVARAFKGGL